MLDKCENWIRFKKEYPNFKDYGSDEVIAHYNFWLKLLNDIHYVNGWTPIRKAMKARLNDS